ncbi:MAG: hypothetical protein GY703_16335 [Gammaproteobacteria bacterium]|nr:hypothetical protein [Gammaproteobacteria bacterium]
MIRNSEGIKVVTRENMEIDGITTNYDFVIPENGPTGNWKFKCIIKDREGRVKRTTRFTVAESPTTEPPPVEPPPVEPPPVEPPEGGYVDGPIDAHNTITEYNGPASCISCHQQEAAEMLDSLHMQWSGPTPQLTNTNGEALGKAVGGINTFCTYAVSSKGACYSCHVRADGNAPHPPEATDVDCLMCHSDTYQRKFIADPENTETVTNIDGATKTYVFGKVDDQGNYTTVPDFDKMPADTDMVNVARTVHLPTTKSCLRCHAKAGGGDWTKRGDMGLNSVNPTVDEDVHLSQNGANISCVNCHSALNHKISGRGIDLRQTEAPAPTCQACHTPAPHASATLNRHAEGQISCQVCHIREYAKGGATEISRDWRNPVWNPAFCSGQGGYVGEEIKESFVKPEYVWFDGTSYVYNVGETIEPDGRGLYPMARANGAPFDGRASIVPIKRHFTIMPLHESGKIIPPAIMWMFMTGDFDIAVQKGMEEQGMTGNYSLVEADAEMLITHGVEPKENAPSCTECHDNSGATPDGTGMLPLASLGYHQVPAEVRSCTLCHEQKSMQWDDMHQSHRQDNVSCTSCHSSEPTGLVQAESVLCRSCHENKSWKEEGHKKHVKKGLECITCHTFS